MSAPPPMSRAQGDKLVTIAKKAGRTLDDVTELWHERAAIREYEGGMPRRVAESDAMFDVAEAVLR